MARLEKSSKTPQAKTPVWVIFLVVGCTLFLAAAQIMLKLGRAPGLPLLNAWIIAGLFCFALGGLIMTYGLKHGELSVLYPLVSLGFIWVALTSHFWLQETLPPHQMAGIVFIIIGVSVIGHGGSR